MELNFPPLSTWLSLILLLTAATTVRAYVSVNLMSTLNLTISYKNYTYNSFFDSSFTNSAGFQMTGYLYELSPESSCSAVPTIPNSTNSTDSWFAVFSSYPSCFNEVVENVADAGYELLVIADAAGFNSSAPDMGMYALPIVVVSENYADYLIETALSEFSDPDVLAAVNTNNTLFFIVVSIGLVMVVTSLCLTLIWCAFKCGVHSVGPSHPDTDLNRSSTYHQLTDSTSSVQRPLGMEGTNQIPSKRYKKQSTTTESCAICCSELKDGDTVRLLPCGHNTFHTDCLDDWLMKYRRSCPLCRRNVTKKKTKVQADINDNEDRDDMESNVPLMSGRQEERDYRSTSASAV